jgi:two-component system chemotaxis response regulator CheB
MSAPTSRTALPPAFRRAVRLVAVGASAGGVEALLQLFSALPAGFALPLVTVLHLPDNRESLLTELLATRCAIPVREITDKQPLEPGVLYVAPPGYHVLLESGLAFSLSCDAPVRFSRPSIDVLFESLADALGANFAAVVLTGANDDGALGLARAGAGGALTVVQDPREAQVGDMPRAAIAARAPDFILTLKDIRELMNHLEPLQ